MLGIFQPSGTTKDCLTSEHDSTDFNTRRACSSLQHMAKPTLSITRWQHLLFLCLHMSTLVLFIFKWGHNSSHLSAGWKYGGEPLIHVLFPHKMQFLLHATPSAIANSFFASSAWAAQIGNVKTWDSSIKSCSLKFWKMDMTGHLHFWLCAVLLLIHFIQKQFDSPCQCLSTPFWGTALESGKTGLQPRIWGSAKAAEGEKIP